MAKIRNRKKNAGSRGFTLIEVTLAVVILAIALITLLGLQSSIIRRTLRDEERQRAMLTARSILSAIENYGQKVEFQDKTMTAEELLKTFIVVNSEDDDERNQLFKFMAHITVENWPIPRIDEKALKRIRLSIYTEQNPEDAFNVLFFIPNRDDEIEEG